MDTDDGKTAVAQVEFAHPSEAEFARLLDFYQISWDYEPRTFEIEWDEDGRAIKCFTPDFYLVDYDLYIEVTTMKQSLITQKRRKTRRLQQLYPEINIKLLTVRDFENLFAKYGIG